MHGIIQATKPSNSGKTLGVCIGDKWYSSKAFEMAALQGKEITFTTSHQAFPDGGGIDWINDYSEAGAAPTTADAAFNQAMAAAPPMGSPQPPVQAPQTPVAPQTPKSSGVDRDCSIVAQALTKACTGPGDDVNKVWARYCSFYRFAMKGIPDAAPTAAPADFSDEIPY